MDSADDIASAVSAIGRIDAVPTLLAVLCEVTGMRFAVVARVSETNWTACAVQDGIHLGVKPGGELAVDTTLCFESRRDRAPIVIEHASFDPQYRTHHVPKLYRIESYVSVPIILGNGDYFGNLCALDPSPAKVPPRIVAMFTRFAALIAAQLDSQSSHEQAHRALRDELAVGELREQFIAILGHDLRNPLHAVMASGDLLERKVTDPALLGIAARIKVSARRMSALIDDVLDFARGRLGGGIGIEVKEVQNINSGLAAVVQELREAQPNCHIITDVRVDRSVPCDLGRLQQVASNLLSNALTHGLAGSPVKFGTRVEEEELVIEVWNAGEPIAAEILDKIFEPFWRHSGSANRNGLGLGLHICSQIVRAHRGSISVSSTRESGTRFTARLPLGFDLTKTVAPTHNGDARPSASTPRDFIAASR